MIHGAPPVQPTGAPHAGRSLDEWLAEYLRLLDAGEPVDRQAYLESCPEQLRAELGLLLETADLVDQMAGPAQTSASSPPGPDSLTQPHRPGERLGSGSWLAEPEPGELFGDYELLNVLGRGGMGVVFKARQLSLNRIVAVKMILAGRLATDEDIQRFYAEAEAAGKVEHPNIVTVYQVGEVDGRHYFSMDLIEGPNLAELCRSGPIEPQQAAELLRVVTEAVEFAHSEGILHRDLKPANILIDRGNRPCVTDFGLAKHLEADWGLTMTGAAIGTPSYMPPEQATSQWDKVGPASDVYSLGAILYVMLTGQPPFRAATALDTIFAVVHNAPRPPRELNPAADPALETICLKCLEKDPSRRYATARELAEDLGRYLRGEPIHARPIGPLRKTLHWSLGIPIVAALLSRRAPLPTTGQMRAQAALILFVILSVVALVLWVRFPAADFERMPDTIEIAAGRAGGTYQQFSERLAQQLRATTGSMAQVTTTSGSVENSLRVTSGASHLALLQAGALHGDEVRVVAPAFYEYVHIVVRVDRPIERLRDLESRWICLGEPGSGSRLTAQALAAYFQLPTNSPVSDYDWNQFVADNAADAAIVTYALHSEPLDSALDSGQFRLLSLPLTDDWDDPTLERCHLPQSVYPRALSDPSGWETLRTPAFLVARPTCPAALVRATLDAFYQLENFEIISQRTAANWTFLPWHRAAREYYDALR